MNPRRSEALRSAAAAVLFLGTGSVAGAAAPTTTDACTLLSASQVSTVLGVAVTEGEHIVPNSLTSCAWMGPGGASIGSKKMVVSVMTARSFQTGKTPVKGVTKTVVAGIGDEAYYIDMPPFGTALSVRKGGVFLQLRIAGFPSGQVRTLERALALRLLDRV